MAAVFPVRAPAPYPVRATLPLLARNLNHPGLTTNPGGVHRLAQAICSLCLALGTASAAPLVLTGLFRIGGESRAFFEDPATGGYFSLTPGEEGGGIRLLTVEFKDRWALVADHTGTNRIVFGTKDLPRSEPNRAGLTQLDNPLPSDRPRRQIAGLTTTGQLPAGSAGPEAAFGRESRAVAGPAETANLGVANEAPASLDEAAAQPAAPVRRRAPADELFKARNGYGAWEELLKQRHQAELLAQAQSAPENP